MLVLLFISHTHLEVIYVYLLCILEKWKAGSLEHTLRYTPQEKLDWLVSPSELREVAKRLPNWQLLVSQLHITKEEEEIISNYPSELQSLKCLQKWSRKQGRMATYRTLVNAIQNMGSTDFYNCICKLLSVPSTPSPDHIQIQHYAEILRRSYLRLIPPNIFEDSNGKLGPSPSEKYINLVMTTRERVQRGGVDTEHLSLALHGNTQGMADYMRRKGQKVPVDVKDIFTINNAQNKLILIEGAPGSGKTTLSRHIVKTWAIGEQFQQFSLVLLIQLRDRVVQEAQGLADLLPFEYSLAERKAITEHIEQKDGEGILLLFDGWDELPEHKQRKSLFLDILNLPSKYHLLKSTVVITSRPIASTAIQNIGTCTRVETLGFTSEQIDRYIKESLPKEEANKLISTIREDPVLEENCYLPLSLAIITHISMTHKNKLPATFCRIIIELALVRLYRHMLKHHIQKWSWHYIKKKTYYYIKKCIHPHSTREDMHKTLTSFNDLEGEMKQKFEYLCKIAYDSILEQKYLFDDPKMPTLGLMQSVQSFAVRGKSTEHYFLHLSLHELCAAWHLVTLPPSEQERILPGYLMGRTSQMENVLGFFSALGGWKSQENKNLLFRHTFNSKTILKNVKDDSIGPVYTEPRPLTQLHYFHEAQSAVLCELLHSMIHINFLHTSGHTSRDIVAMRYIICNKKLESLALSWISDEHLKALKPTLRKNMPNELGIGNCRHLGHEGWKIIAELMLQTDMKAFYCGIGKITSADIDCLGTALQRCKLASLVAFFINIGDTGLVQFAKYVENTELTHLCLDCCEIGDEGIASLSAVLPNTKLTTLSLGGNSITSRGLTVLANAIMNTPNFRKINISKADKLTPGRDIQDFLEQLSHHPQFSEIVINVHTINETFREYFEGLNRRRMELGLQMVNIAINDSVVPDGVDKRCWLTHFNP